MEVLLVLFALMVGGAGVGVFERKKSGRHCSCSFFAVRLKKGLMRGPWVLKEGSLVLLYEKSSFFFTDV